jgi:uncharacterized delta-60 repeat protein
MNAGTYTLCKVVLFHMQFILLMLPGPYLLGQPGTLDNTFGQSGLLTYDLDSATETIYSVLVQPDGKIIASGVVDYSSFDPNDFASARFKTDGSLDITYGDNGKVILDIGGTDNCYASVLQSDGKIIMAGNSEDGGVRYVVLVRLNTDGSLDSSFGGSGIVKIGDDFEYAHGGTSVVIQADGKIVITAIHFDSPSDWDFCLIRVTTTGVLDGSFGNGGIVITEISNDSDYLEEIAIQPDGKIVAIGYSYDGYGVVVARYDNDGTLDNTFGSGGVITANFENFTFCEATDVAIQPDDKILVAGRVGISEYQFAVARLTADGNLDNSFSSNGILIPEIMLDNTINVSVAVEANGKILLGSTAFDGYIVVRLNLNGTIDSTFGQDGMALTGTFGILRDLKVQPDGKILAAGSSSGDFAMARFISDVAVGQSVFGEDLSMLLIYPNPVSTDFILQYVLLDDVQLNFSLFDMHGRLRQQIGEGLRRRGLNTECIFLDPLLAEGVYFLKISSKEMSNMIPLMKL